MFQYWFPQHLNDAEIVDRMHEIAKEYSTAQIANRIELLKQRVQNDAIKLHQSQAESEEQIAPVDSLYAIEVSHDLERSTWELLLLGKIVDGDY